MKKFLLVELFAVFPHHHFDICIGFRDNPLFFLILVIYALSSFASVFLEDSRFYGSFQRSSLLFHWFSYFQFHWLLLLSLLFSSFCLVSVYFALFSRFLRWGFQAIDLRLFLFSNALSAVSSALSAISFPLGVLVMSHKY